MNYICISTTGYGGLRLKFDNGGDFCAITYSGYSSLAEIKRLFRLELKKRGINAGRVKYLWI